MKVNTEIPAGTLIVFSSGCYSDYGYNGHFVTLEALTRDKFTKAIEATMHKKAESDAALKEWGEKREGKYPGSMNVQEAFIAEMIRGGLLLSVNVHEIHLGEYSELEIDL